MLNVLMLIIILSPQNELFQLVTDQGFLNESNVIWETLNNIEGDGEFVDHGFRLVPPKKTASVSMEYMSAEEVKNQEDQDYMLALSLQEEYKKELEQLKEWERDKAAAGIVECSDEELARRLQQEEEEKQRQRHQQQQQNVTHLPIKNLKIQDRSSSNASRESSTTASSSHHQPHCHQEDLQYAHRTGVGQQHQQQQVRHEHKVVFTDDISPRSQPARPSPAGQSGSRRRTTSDSYATDQYNRRSPAGRDSHSDGAAAQDDSSGSQRDHRRNKSSVSY